jgi:hypothetical protein
MLRFRQIGVTHLLVPDDFPDPAIRDFRQRPYWWDRLVPLMVQEGMRLYRLVPDPALEGGGKVARAADPADRGFS